jgi:hypothetical protein
MEDTTYNNYCLFRSRFPQEEEKLRSFFLQKDGFGLSSPEASAIDRFHAGARRDVRVARFLNVLFGVGGFLVLMLFGIANIFFGYFNNFVEVSLLALSYILLLFYYYMYITLGYCKKRYAQALHVVISLAELRDTELIEKLQAMAKERKDLQTVLSRGITIYEAAHLLGCPQEEKR